VQQYVAEPALPAVGALQLSEGYALVGGSEAFEQENPKPPPGQLTVESAPHVVSVVLVVKQQYSVEPALPAVPSLQRSEGLDWSGVSPLVHE